MFFTVVPDRSSETLTSIIRRYVLPGTEIHTDCWKGYAGLSQQGYIHKTVNHSVEFVAADGTNTQQIESRWNALKRFLPTTGKFGWS